MTELEILVADAIDLSSCVWLRCIEEEDGLPWQSCRYGRSNEPEIVVIASSRTESIAMKTSFELIRQFRAQAAIQAIKDYLT